MKLPLVSFNNYSILSNILTVNITTYDRTGSNNLHFNKMGVLTYTHLTKEASYFTSSKQIFSSE